LEDFETKIVVRPLKIEDFDELIAMQQLCFPGMPSWTREHIESQISHFPEGQIVVQYEDDIVASASCLIVDFDRYSEWHNWKEIADNGYIRNHTPDGDTLYGIEIMVHPECRGMRLSRRLYDERKRIARQRNIARIIVAGRVPGYGAHADEMTAREYVECVMRKELYDPVLTAQTANGFVLKGLIPNYLPDDHASRGYATFLEWVNLEYQSPKQRRYQAVSLVRLAVIQYLLRPIGSFEDFATQCEFFVDTAAEYKSDFVVFPELISTQLLSYMGGDVRPGLAARKLAEITPRYVNLFRDLAINHNINIIAGSHFEVDGGRLYNVGYLCRRDGTLERQPKLHITPSERKWWGVEPGDEVRVFDTDSGRIAILICYDIEFPEVARIAAGKGADIIFVPFNTDVRSGYLRVRTCAQARAIENEVYVAISGCAGNLPFVENADIHYAQSGIFTPSDAPFARDGIAAECHPNAETMVVQDVDLETLRRARYSGAVQNWKDRRTDLYRINWTEGGEPHEI
jgi:predicted amidohydrolase/ribosomal protein S18 acetylase RimI-like enzyme